MSNQEQEVRILDNALWRIAHRGECEYLDTVPNERPTPCDCSHCVAVAALDASKSWRFQGSHYSRTQNGHWPRETKIHAAWMKLALSQSPDYLLSQILGGGQVPSARDWFVATSVVQWLATNVGMAVLENAGFKYAGWDEDRASAERARQQEASLHEQ